MVLFPIFISVPSGIFFVLILNRFLSSDEFLKYVSSATAFTNSPAMLLTSSFASLSYLSVISVMAFILFSLYSFTAFSTILPFISSMSSFFPDIIFSLMSLSISETFNPLAILLCANNDFIISVLERNRFLIIFIESASMYP